MAETMVERVARAIFQVERDLARSIGVDHYEWHEFLENDRNNFFTLADAAIAAHLEALREAGMVVVPREPTIEMLSAMAGAQVFIPGFGPDISNGQDKRKWKAGVAALTPDDGQGEG